MAKKSFDVEINFTGNINSGKGSKFGSDTAKSLEKETTMSMGKKTKDIFEAIVGDVFMTSIMALPRIASMLVAGLRWILPAVIVGLLVGTPLADMFRAKDETGVDDGKKDDEGILKNFASTVLGAGEALFKDIKGDERLYNESEQEDKQELTEELLTPDTMSPPADEGKKFDIADITKDIDAAAEATNTKVDTMQTTFNTTMASMEKIVSDFFPEKENTPVEAGQSKAKTPFEQMLESGNSGENMCIETSFKPTIETDSMSSAITKEGEMIDTLKSSHYEPFNTTLQKVVDKLKYIKTLQDQVSSLSGELNSSKLPTLYTNTQGQVIGMDDPVTQQCVVINTRDQPTSVFATSGTYAQQTKSS